MSGSERLAVVLFNLGGPDRPAAVQPFLQNLFSDPAILRVPSVVRWFLARLISRLRARKAGAIYANLGGGSPLLPNTQAQAAALLAALKLSLPAGTAVECFIAMRYWHPLTAETVRAVKAWGPTRIVLLPLYPQHSTTTTASSAAVWKTEALRLKLTAPTHTVCCYPVEAGFVAASVALIEDAVAQTGPGPVRILVSAHGLPEQVVADGDPYAWQVEQTAAAIQARLGPSAPEVRVCYQSRVGPLKWIGPSTEEEIHKAGAEGQAVVLFPIAFVSEHSETLVELDIEYRELAEEAQVRHYQRVPTVSVTHQFIEGLAQTVRAALAAPPGLCPPERKRLCPSHFKGCPVELAPETSV